MIFKFNLIGDEMQLINGIKSVFDWVKDFLRNNLFKRASGDTWSDFVEPEKSLDEVYNNLHTIWTNKHTKTTCNGYLWGANAKEFNLWLETATPTAITNSGVNILKPVAGDNDKIFDAFVSLI